MVKEVQGPVTAGRGVKTTFIELLGSNPLLPSSAHIGRFSDCQYIGKHRLERNKYKQHQKLSVSLNSFLCDNKV